MTGLVYVYTCLSTLPSAQPFCEDAHGCRSLSRQVRAQMHIHVSSRYIYIRSQTPFDIFTLTRIAAVVLDAGRTPYAFPCTRGGQIAAHACWNPSSIPSCLCQRILTQSEEVEMSRVVCRPSTSDRRQWYASAALHQPLLLQHDLLVLDLDRNTDADLASLLFHC